MKNKLLLALFAALSLSLAGCGGISKVGASAFNAVEKGAELTDDGIRRSDEIAADATERKIERTTERIEFLDEVGSEVDNVQVDWLESRLTRMANFLCSLHDRGVQLGAIPTSTGDGYVVVACEKPPDG